MPDSFSSASTANVAIPLPSSDLVEALKSDLLTVYRAVIALEKRVNECTINMTEIKPQLIALKVHAESLPNALRELRRSHTATQQLVSDFDARLKTLEAQMKGTAASSTT
jgi:chromosome segregation ATPase